MYVQVLLARIMSSLFTFNGYSVLQTEDRLFVEGFCFRFSGLCTYINRILIAIPFVLRIDGIGYNILRMLVFVGTVSVINIFRIYFALTWYIRGIPWKYSHTLFTHLISWLIFILTITLWLKSLRTSQMKKMET